jgi:hypothetical protein
MHKYEYKFSYRNYYGDLLFGENIINARDYQEAEEMALALCSKRECHLISLIQMITKEGE